MHAQGKAFVFPRSLFPGAMESSSAASFFFFFVEVKHRNVVCLISHVRAAWNDSRRRRIRSLANETRLEGKRESGLGGRVWVAGGGATGLVERPVCSPQFWPLCRVNDATNMFFKDHTVIHGFH